ncbi:MAG: aspartate--tRNA ligase [Chitinophagaceae bacterium]
MYRTFTCGELRISDVNKQVILAGWIQAIRNFGSITFVDLRDLYGVTQLSFKEDLNDLFQSQHIGREFVLQAEGKVIERSNKNIQITTGEIEIEVLKFIVLNPSATPPFTIQEDTDGGNELRMKFRFLDLRRPSLQQNMTLRHQVGKATREYLNTHEFLDIETPFLIKSTPEGARDFVVPSRMNEGEFYALPQSPQTFKQLLMVSGFDRYYQIVRCFRDEDLRADRQPEFTQIDCEMSFVKQNDVLNMFEGLIKHIFKAVKNISFPDALPRISYKDALFYYGNDKPDIRFDMKIKNLKVKNSIHCNILENISFKVFNEAETILAIVVPNGANYSRKQIDHLTEFVKQSQLGMQGLAYIKIENNLCKSSFDKFFDNSQLHQIQIFCKAKGNDLILLLAGGEKKVRKAMSELRLKVGSDLGLRKQDHFQLLWVIDFPLFEYDEENDLYTAMHHPFTSPRPDEIYKLDNKNLFGTITAQAYDMVLNGTEIGGGSIRIHERQVQEKMFKALGLTETEATEKFGFLLSAFEYGAPPHGGIAFGFDRICALLGGSDSIRDFIAFPKNNTGQDMMLNSPSMLEEKQLQELFIKVVTP